MPRSPWRSLAVLLIATATLTALPACSVDFGKGYTRFHRAIAGDAQDEREALLEELEEKYGEPPQAEEAPAASRDSR